MTTTKKMCSSSVEAVVVVVTVVMVMAPWCGTLAMPLEPEPRQFVYQPGSPSVRLYPVHFQHYLKSSSGRIDHTSGQGFLLNMLPPEAEKTTERPQTNTEEATRPPPPAATSTTTTATITTTTTTTTPTTTTTSITTNTAPSEHRMVHETTTAPTMMMNTMIDTTMEPDDMKTMIMGKNEEDMMNEEVGDDANYDGDNTSPHTEATNADADMTMMEGKEVVEEEDETVMVEGGIGEGGRGSDGDGSDKTEMTTTMMEEDDKEMVEMMDAPTELLNATEKEVMAESTKDMSAAAITEPTAAEEEAPTTDVMPKEETMTEVPTVQE